MNIKNEIIIYVGNVMIQKRLGTFSTTCAECSKQLVENGPNHCHWRKNVGPFT
jgi:hypothetical protein